jgi:hypothetical protein
VLDLAAAHVSAQAELFDQASGRPLSTPADQTLQHRPDRLSMAAHRRLARRRVDQHGSFYPILDEATAALDRAGQFLSAHLAGAERVAA